MLKLTRAGITTHYNQSNRKRAGLERRKRHHTPQSRFHMGLCAQFVPSPAIRETHSLAVWRSLAVHHDSPAFDLFGPKAYQCLAMGTVD